MSHAGNYVVLEPNVQGHRLAYVNLLSSVTSEAPAQWLTVMGAPESIEAREHLDESLRAGAVTRPRGTRWVAAASKLAHEQGTTRLVIPDGDVRLLEVLMAQPMLILRRQSVSILLMRTGVAAGRQNAVRLIAKQAIVRFLCLAPRIHIFQLTDCFGVGRGRRRFRHAPPVRDPISCTEIGRNPVRQVMNERLAWVGICGAIDARKNVRLAIASVSASEAVGLVIAGKLSPEVSSCLANNCLAMKLSAEGRLIIHDQLLHDSELNAVLADLNAVLILHDNDAPSGIMGRAAALGTPAIVAVGGWLARIVNLTGAGCDAELTTDSVCIALQTVASNRESYSSAALQAMRDHSVDELPTALVTQR